MKRARRLPRRLQRELKDLEALPDDEIDTSDIPEITDADWKSRKVGALYRPIKKSVTIRLDSDLLAWFKARGRGYQTAINRVLREYVSRSR
jgi:uncharacterized protein (DUF4415 family)